MHLVTIKNFKASANYQKGAASLVMSMVILALITFVTIYTSRSILNEQKIANNDYRAKQAFGAAEAGIAEAISYLSEDPDRNLDGAIDLVFDKDTDNVGTTNAATIGDGSVTLTTTDLSDDGDMTIIRIQAVGFSADNTATRTIFRDISTLNPLPNMPDNPMTARGSMIVNGSATIYNPEGHSTIWSGDNVALGSNNSTATQVADPTDAGYPTCMDTPMTCNTIQSSNKVTIGLDVIEHDSNLANLSDDEFFFNFFGMSRTTYKDTMVTVEADHTDANTKAHLTTEEVIWVDGSGGTTDLNGITMGCVTAQTGSNVCPNNQTKPSILVVDGNATFSGSPQFYGIVFVTGTISVTGGTSVHGALVTGSTLTSTTGGGLSIWYNSEILRSARKTGRTGTSAGSWRDFDV